MTVNEVRNVVCCICNKEVEISKADVLYDTDVWWNKAIGQWCTTCGECEDRIRDTRVRGVQSYCNSGYYQNSNVWTYESAETKAYSPTTVKATKQLTAGDTQAIPTNVP
jgi:uncharacterized protein YlaI